MLESRNRQAPEIRRRPARPQDAQILKGWRSEASVRQHQPLSELTVAQLRSDVANQRMADLYRSRGEKFQWIVLVDGEAAGWITLVVSNWEHGLAEVGYALSSAYQRQGVMGEALADLLDEIFHRTTLERIEARCAVDNRASQKVLERIGFQREGRLRGYFKLRGERVDNFLYAVLQQDWI
jgi:RimJ/RimL family protein N-acetyltransferase